ncbi:MULTISPECIES: mannosyltransferase [Mycobacteriaceae]|uniref:mannosyltransferase n=1 Tax=Mycobacteriaceae TaxID=1762 RepID=UPI0009DBEF03|nr:MULTISPECIES: mannosyltransferase [Mycobacteriaceae]
MLGVSHRPTKIDDWSAVKRLGERAITLAPWLLVVSIAIRSIGTTNIPDMFVDLRVYIAGGAALDHPGTLYQLSYTDLLGEQLPFIYPPFAAMLFYPLQWLPFFVVAWLWQFATIACLYGIVRISQRMIGRGGHRVAMLWTAAAIWLEPIRLLLNYSQVGVFLTFAALYAAYTSRSWLAGLLVGLAAGVKITPAITGLYFLAMRRWAAAAFAVAAFFATVGITALIAPGETREFFVALFRRVPVSTGTSNNQSWLGTVSRIVGYDAGHTVLVPLAIAATAVLSICAWRALGKTGNRDVLGSLLVVQLFGLMASPISWTHHWVWLIPLMIWLINGPWRDQPGARVLGWVWFAVLLIGIPSALSLLQSSVWTFSRPWYLAWGAAVYVPMTLATLGWMIFAGRRITRRTPHQCDGPVALDIDAEVSADRVVQVPVDPQPVGRAVSSAVPQTR